MGFMTHYENQFEHLNKAHLNIYMSVCSSSIDLDKWLNCLRERERQASTLDTQQIKHQRVSRHMITPRNLLDIHPLLKLDLENKMC